METRIPEEILDFLRGHEVFFIIGHVEPDGDCIGSQLALCSLLHRLGKKAYVLQDGPFDRPEIETFTGSFILDIPKTASNESPVVIVLDCSTTDRVSERYKPLLSFPVLVIDHHVAGDAFGTLRYTDSQAASTTTLIVRLFHALGKTPTDSEAGRLFFGLATDTGFFRHCEKQCDEVFSTALFLVEQGAGPKETYGLMYGNRSFGQRKLLGKLLEKAESLFAGRLIVTTQTMKEREEAGPNVRSSEELYSLFQTVKGVEAIAFLREESSGLVSVGLRSLKRIDVASIAQTHGGGGHKLASGFNYSGSLDAAKSIVIKEFEKYFLD